MQDNQDANQGKNTEVSKVKRKKRKTSTVSSINPLDCSAIPKLDV